MMLRRHAHRWEYRWRRRRTIGSSGRTRVVLTATPRKPDPRVTDGVALHLVDSHLCCVSLNKLHKTTSLARRYLDIGDFAKALEEGTKFVLRHISRKPSNENGGIVGISKLVHGLRGTIVAHWGSTHGIHAHWSSGTRHGGRGTGPAFGSSGGDAHGAVAAVDTLHFSQGAVLVLLIRETNEPIAARHSADGVGHDLCGLARREPRLEERDENVLVDLGAKIADENGVLGAAVITGIVSLHVASIVLLGHKPSVGKSTSGGPVQLERSGAVGNLGSVEIQGLGGSSGVLEFHKAIASVSTWMLA
jgi:hypothetical protein